ncbi:DUF5110 domain-containing protein [Muribaculaceae bacterium Isolate-002 (NCI)]|nr:DUF5110 domain-containing protein [Muribaculaceae bacterium Isolate-002 (NCI)]
MKNKLTFFYLLSFIFLGAITLKGETKGNPKADPGAVVTSGNARFTVLTPEMIRIEYSDKGVFEDRATFTVVNRQLAVPQYKTSEDETFLYLETAKLKMKYRKGSNPKTLPASSSNLSITIDHNGREVLWYPGKPDPMNLKGTCRTLDGSNGQNKRSEMEDGLISRSGWAVIDDSWTSARADGSRSFALEADENLGYDWWSDRNDPHAMDIYFLGYGNNYKKALSDYTSIAGKIPLPPAYVFGYWYSKYSSYSADDYRDIMNNLSSNDIPTDVMILDMDWHWNGSEGSMSGGRGGWTGWSWNTNLIPDPVGLLKEMHDRNFKVALNLHPADGVNSVESPEFFTAMNEDLRGKYNVNASSGKTIPWYLDYTDFTDSFFRTIIREHESEGVDFWWLDWQQHLTSPYTNGLGQTFWCNHVFYNDMAANRPDRRPVIFHRWGGLGSHRYQIGFSGDALINFPTLAFQPYFTATASNVGYGYWGHDLGGHAFTDEKTVNDPELVLRWIQFGVFTPIFRTHATNDSRIERRIWMFPNFPDMLEAVKLRYSLFPYIYTMAREAYDTGISLCRPLYYEYPEVEEAYAYEEEYFFGSDILVAPIVEASENGVCTKTIWFPEGNWWSVATNELIEGPCTMTMEFSKTDIPYFYREGSIVPLNPASVKNVTEHPEHLVINVVSGKEGKGKLYEDEGDNSDYDVAYATTAFTQTLNGNKRTLVINPREGNSSNLPAMRSYTVNVYNSNAPQAVIVNGDAITQYSYSPESKCTTVEIPVNACASAVTVEIEEAAAGIAGVMVNSTKIYYDKSSDTLTAEFGQNKNNVEFAMFNMSGSECLNHKYQNISRFSEKLSMLSSPQMYVCKIIADNQVTVEKISK